MDLSVIIVNYKSSRLILDCINTIVAETTVISYEVIVVDNASGDNSEQEILAAYPFVQFIQMGYNAGFSRANNAGLRAAKGDHLLLLNPDTLILQHALDRSVQRFAESNFVACGVQQLNADRSLQISGNYFMKGGLNHLLPLPYWGKVIRWIGYQLKTKVPNVQEAGTAHEVDWISGAFLMVKRSTLDKAGYMDEDFFLYAEEVEWCSRLRKQGGLVIFGDINIIHLQGETTGDAFDSAEKGYYGLYDRKGLQLMLSNHVRVRKQFGVAWYFILLLNYTFAIPVFFFGSLLEGIFRLHNPFRYMPQVWGLTKNVCYLWCLTPVIIKNKPHFYKVL
jgi:GT2 family glycosyltransferase